MIVADQSLLESAVFRPATSLGGTLKYPTVETSAAALLHSIIQDHPFHNGNKRTALVASLVFLDENGFFPDFDEDEVFRIVMQTAQHRIADVALGDVADREVLAISDWLCAHCRTVEQGNRQIPFRKLRRILVRFGCHIYGPFGNKVEVTRSIGRQGILQRIFRGGTTTLRTQLSYNGEGRDVGRATIKKIRHDLQLDDQHATDSHAFYSSEAMRAEDFIAYYRKALDRLARF
jgi:death-on-curing family protein